MKPVIYITPDGSANCIQDCPEEPKHSITHYQQFANPVLERKTDIAVYRQALAEAKKNSIPFESQKEVINKLFPNSAPFTDSLHPLPDQYKVEIKELRTWDEEKTRCNECCNGDRCDDPTHLNRRNCPYCKGTGKLKSNKLAVLSPLKPQEDKLISEDKPQCPFCGARDSLSTRKEMVSKPTNSGLLWATFDIWECNSCKESFFQHWKFDYIETDNA